jgi:hypothetical protein
MNLKSTYSDQTINFSRAFSFKTLVIRQLPRRPVDILEGMDRKGKDREKRGLGQSGRSRHLPQPKFVKNHPTKPTHS